MNALNAARPRWRGPLIKMAAAVLCCLANVAAAQTVTITGADCTRLIAHVPAPNVEYTPGVDVRGRSVAPADLGGRPKMKFPDTVEFPVLLQLLQRLGLPANSSLYKLEDVNVGTVRVRVKDGRAWFNGAPLTSEENHVMARACRKLGSGTPP